MSECKEGKEERDLFCEGDLQVGENEESDDDVKEVVTHSVEEGAESRGLVVFSCHGAVRTVQNGAQDEQSCRREILFSSQQDQNWNHNKKSGNGDDVGVEKIWKTVNQSVHVAVRHRLFF